MITLSSLLATVFLFVATPPLFACAILLTRKLNNKYAEVSQEVVGGKE